MRNNKKQIFFLLPGDNGGPIGGLKIAYVYADHLASIGFDVTILCDVCCLWDKYSTYSLYRKFRHYCGHLLRKIFHKYHPASWYSFKNKVQVKIAYNTTHLPIGSKLIFTGYQCLENVIKIKEIPNKDKFYFIQGYEAWEGTTEEDLAKSYRLGFVNMVIAPWLQEKVEKAGSTAVLLPNGFDFNYFKLTNPIENRNPYEIAMLYHTDKLKGCDVSIKALMKVKEKEPKLHVTMFGTPKQPENMPDWFSYYQLPDKETHNKIYNNSSIFVAASVAEGFGLTVGEAMIGGETVCCTNAGGFLMMVHDGETGLLSPVGNVDKLADNILKLVRDNDLRIKYAKAANFYIHTFTWKRSFKIIDELLK